MDDTPRAMGIGEFCRRYGIGKTTAFAEIKHGRLHAKKCNARTLISTDAAEAWLKNLPLAGADTTATRLRNRA